MISFMLEVPRIRSYNNCMLNEIVIGSEVTDGFEDGVVVAIEMDGGDKWYCVWDGKEAWKMHEREAKLVTFPASSSSEKNL